MTPVLHWVTTPTGTASDDGRFYAEERGTRWHLYTRHRFIAAYATKEDAENAAERHASERAKR